MVKERYKKQIIQAIEKFLPNCKIYLFGSRATGSHMPTSDIDIAIDNSKPIKLSVMLELEEFIEDLPIPFEFDIVDLNNAPKDLKKEILKERVLWKS